MTAPALLGIPMFLLIFGPKSSGWVDVVSLTAGCLILAHFFFLNTSHIPWSVCRRTVTLTLVFLGLMAFATIHCLMQSEPNTYQILRFGRVVVNLLGVAALASFYYRVHGAQAGPVIVRHLFHCLVAHALIMVAMFYSQGFRDLIVNQVVQADPDSRTYLAKASGYRISGLTDSWDALSGLQSLGLLILPLLLSQQPRISYGYAIFSAPLLLFSVAISGRTGLVTWLALLPGSLYFADLRRLYRSTIVLLLVGLVGLVLVRGPLRGASEQLLDSTSLGRTMAMFGWQMQASGDEQIRDTFVGILEAHYFLPESWQTLVWGSGGSGRDNWDYVPADNGPVLNLHNLGIGGFLLIYGVLGGLLWTGWKIRHKSPQIAGVSLLAAALIALIDVKVSYMCARNGFTVMLLPAFASWWQAEHAVRRLPEIRPLLAA